MTCPRLLGYSFTIALGAVRAKADARSLVRPVGGSAARVGVGMAKKASARTGTTGRRRVMGFGSSTRQTDLKPSVGAEAERAGAELPGGPRGLLIARPDGRLDLLRSGHAVAALLGHRPAIDGHGELPLTAVNDLDVQPLFLPQFRRHT